VDDFEPTLGHATQGIGVTLTFIAMVAVVDFGPRTPGQGFSANRCMAWRRCLSQGQRGETDRKITPNHGPKISWFSVKMARKSL
jgi:hypothetical protein